MRRAKLEEQYSKYERVVIRIQFQDKLVLQGLFKPRETGMLSDILFILKIVYTCFGLM